MLDSLPTELVLQICGHLDSVADLFVCYRVSTRFRDILDTYGHEVLDTVGPKQFDGFESALILARLRRKLKTDKSSVCSFDLNTRRFVNIPERAWLEKLSKGKRCEDNTSWRREAKEIVDIYLFGLAFMCNHDDPIKSCDMGRWLRAFYRYLIFTTLFGPGVFSEPIVEATTHAPSYAINNRRHDNFWDGYGVPHGHSIPTQALDRLREYIVFSEPTREYRCDSAEDLIQYWKRGDEAFDGYFDWLCTQSELEYPEKSYQGLGKVCSMSSQLERQIRMGFKKSSSREDENVDEYKKQTTLYLPWCFFPFRVSRPKPTVKWMKDPVAVMDSLAQSTPSVTARCLMTYTANGLYEAATCTKRYNGYRNWINHNGINFSAIAGRILKTRYERMWDEGALEDGDLFQTRLSTEDDPFALPWNASNMDEDDSETEEV